MRRLWVWVIALGVGILLLLPMPIAERFTSPTQDGQYLTDPVRSYRFVFAAARVPADAKLGRSGEALDEAKAVFNPAAVTVRKVELLFFPDPQAYSFTTRQGEVLDVANTGQFVWEVWGTAASAPSGTELDVVGLLDYQTGEVLASIDGAL